MLDLLLVARFALTCPSIHLSLVHSFLNLDTNLTSSATNCLCLDAVELHSAEPVQDPFYTTTNCGIEHET